MRAKRKTAGKRIVGFLLTLCMALSLLPATALAILDEDLGVISKVEVTIPLLVDRTKPQDYQATISRGANCHLATKEEVAGAPNMPDWEPANNLYWRFDGNGMKVLPTDTLYTSGGYTASMVLVPEEGAYFGMDTVVSFNGKSVKVNGKTDGIYQADLAWGGYIYLHVKLDSVPNKEISGVEILGMQPVQAGTTPSYNFMLPKDANYHFPTKEDLAHLQLNKDVVASMANGVFWVNHTDRKKLLLGEKLEANKAYAFQTILIPDTGYQFAKTVTAKIDGDPKAIVYATSNVGNVTTCSVNYFAEGAQTHSHKGTRVPAKAPTATQTGNLEYYTCSCGKWYADAACTKEITNRDSVILPA